MTSDVQEIKRQADIVAIANDLGIVGANYGKPICCPFHSEKTPSFSFKEPEGGNGGIFKCFGSCDISGDVFDLVMEHQGLEFKEALAFVANSIGYKLDSNEKRQDPFTTYRSTLHSVNSAYRQHFYNSEAHTYLLSRGFTEETITTFEAGYAPYQNVLDQLAGVQGVLEELGLIKINSDSTRYALLRNRVTFPIYDMAGLIVGFGGRSLGNNASIKYINSPDSTIFKKSTFLFGYHLYAKRSKRLIVTEGYFDAMALFQIGFKEAVATMGTAITASMIESLCKKHSEIIFCFDGDKAGIAAAIRCAKNSIPFTATSKPVAFKFCFLPPDQDPCDVALMYGVKGVQYYLDNALYLSEFLIKEAKSAYNNELAVEERIQVMNNLEELLTNAPEGLFKDLIKQEIRKVTHISIDEVASIEVQGDFSSLGRAIELLDEAFDNQIKVTPLANGGFKFRAK